MPRYLRLEELPDSGTLDCGVEGVFFLRLSKKLTPLDIRLEKFRFRFSPNSGLQKVAYIIKD